MLPREPLLGRTGGRVSCRRAAVSPCFCAVATGRRAMGGYRRAIVPLSEAMNRSTALQGVNRPNAAWLGGYQTVIGKVRDAIPSVLHCRKLRGEARCDTINAYWNG
jgi:hypothetical protein